VYWNGKPIAFKAGGSTHFEHQDCQGTERLRTSYNGAVDSNYVSLPFGDGYQASGNDWDWYHFGGLIHDPDSGTEAATFRQYSSIQGRWMSADPYEGSYDANNPQSLNRYSFVLNDPLVYDDPDGTSDDDCPSYTCDSITVVTSPPAPVPITPPAGLPPTIPPGPVGGPGSTGSGTGGSGGGNAPSKPGQPSQNNCRQILTGAATTVGLDALGTFVGAIPGAGAALVTTQVVVGLAAAANSAYHGDAQGTLVSAFGAQASPIAAGAEQIARAGGSIAWGRAAGAIPFVGSLVNAAYFYKDATEALDKYQACQAGH
jgi:RHS repeat-associated protein